MIIRLVESIPEKPISRLFYEQDGESREVEATFDRVTLPDGTIGYQMGVLPAGARLTGYMSAFSPTTGTFYTGPFSEDDDL